jgi:hypothetical protein
MIYTTYDSSGEFLFSVTDNGEYDLPINAVEGTYLSNENYINLETKSIVNKPQQPSLNHHWDVNTKTWLFDNEQATQDNRTKRNELLSQVDRVNPVWYSALTEQQQQELSTYRQQLLDVPQQAEFPVNIMWPTKPSWL